MSIVAHERKRAVRVTSDTFAALVRLWRATGAKWTAPQSRGGYSESTRDHYVRELDLMCRPRCLGALTTEEIRPSLVQRYFDGLDGLPGKQKMGLAVLKELEKWAIVRDYLPRQVTLGVEIGKSHAGHIPWTADQVALAEREATPHLARAVTLAANTGQRGSDLIRMAWTDIEEYEGIRGINVAQQKTKRRVWIPIMDELASAMASWERSPGPFLRHPKGRPWKRGELSRSWTDERGGNPALAPLRIENLQLEPGVDPGKDKGLVLHGCRGFSCVRFHRKGLNDEQIGNLVGMSPDVVKTYTRFAAQKDNAIAALQNIDRTFAERLSRKIAQSA